MKDAVDDQCLRLTFTKDRKLINVPLANQTFPPFFYLSVFFHLGIINNLNDSFYSGTLWYNFDHLHP